MRKTLPAFLLGACLSAFAHAAPPEISAQAWLETYYLNPQPAELPREIQRLSRAGYFEQPGHIAIAIGFISTVFAQHPRAVDGWLLQLNELPLAHQRLLASALWQAGHPLGAQVLPLLARDAANRADVERLATMPSLAIDDTPVLSISSMNLRWGAFLASGDQRHIVSILEAFGDDSPGLDATARSTFAQDAAAHPRVTQICRAQLDRGPEEYRRVLRAILLEASATPVGM